MQPFEVEDLRTAEDTEYVLRVSSAVTSSSGVELLDMQLNVLEDISSECLDGQVNRDSYANLHGQCQLKLTTELDWGSAIVRPYVEYTSDDVTVRFNLGAYFTDMPRFSTGEDVPQYSVDGFDILQILDTPVGSSYQVTALSVGEAISGIFDSLGVTAYRIDPARYETLITRSWAMDPQLTWLGVVNDILQSVGYRGIYSDWDGQLVCEPYISPIDRASEWTYDDDAELVMHEPEFLIERDLYLAPNRWVAVQSRYDETNPPTEGDGIYTVQNEFDGPTSIEARKGRVITRTLQFEAVTQADLVAQTDQTVIADKLIPTKYEVTTSPNPLHWHFDRMTFVDDNVGGQVEVMSTSWTLGLNAASMTHTWVTLSET